jgi:hypothetical protein
VSLDQFALSYQKSPIIFVKGIAANMTGGALPIVSITQAVNFSGGVLDASQGLAWNDYIFDFYPMPGSTLAAYDIGRYPFANQAVAANAVIADPLSVSLLMAAPARGQSAYSQRLSVFQALQAAITKHSQQGGTYNVATPAYLYTNLILLSLRDVSEGDEKRPQDRWVWEFTQPLLTLQQAQAAQSSGLNKITQGLQQVPDANGAITYSGAQPTVGSPPSGAAPATVPAAAPLIGASVSGSGPG